MSLVAGVDSSTQSCKVVIKDADSGALVREGRAPHPPGTSVDPEAWWVALGRAVEAAGGLSDVAALSVAGQQHGMVCLDESGTVVRDALLWNDVRSAGASEDLIAELGGPSAWAEAVGSVPLAAFTITKLRWLATHEPMHAARTVAVCLPHDWLTWRLGGDRSIDALVTDRGDASGTGYWSPLSESYRTDLLQMAFGSVPELPRVLGPSESASTAAADAAAAGGGAAGGGAAGGGAAGGGAAGGGAAGGGAADAAAAGGGAAGGGAAGVVLGAGTGDNAAAALGVAADLGDVIVSVGTSGVVAAVSGRPTVDGSGLVAGFASATGTYLPLVCTLNAALVLDAAARLLGVDHHGLSKLALAAPAGADGLVLVPYLEGERTPNRPDSTGALHGLRLANSTPAHLARATIEGLLCGLADGLDALRSCGVQAGRVILVGGGARSEALRRIAPAILGCPVVVPAPGEYVADGAARQAAWTLSGALPDWSIGDVSRFEADSTPFVRDRYAEVRDLTARRP